METARTLRKRSACKPFAGLAAVWRMR